MLTRADIQRLRGLRAKKHRDASGLFVVEGSRLVDELLSGGVSFAEIYATEDWTVPAGSERLPVVRVSDQEMSRISHFPTPSPVLAVGRISWAALPQGALDRGLTLALDGVQDPGNVGTLIRIADWFAFDRVLLSPDCADPWSSKTIQSSMGSFARVPLHTGDLAAVLQGAGSPILGCELDGESAFDLQAMPDAVVVIGSEGRGLSEALRGLVTRRITIPRFGGAESLNAAVAGGIVCAAIRSRQRRP